jgi:hypothetical protein
MVEVEEKIRVEEKGEIKVVEDDPEEDLEQVIEDKELIDSEKSD